MSRLRPALAALLAAGAFAPAPALALEVSADDAAVRYAAAPGEVNSATVAVVSRQDGPRLRILDFSDSAQSGGQPAPLTVREPCVLVRTAREQPPAPERPLPSPTAQAAHAVPDEIECPVRPALELALGDLDDSLAASAPLGAVVRADGGDGNDVLAGADGADALTGGAGRDLLIGGFGPDRLDGGDDPDTVRYAEPERASGVEVSLGGASSGGAEDGPGGARDRLIGVEDVDGSRFDDRIVGDGGANALDGGPGDDALDGNAGDDAVTGGEGRDRLTGGPGEDTLSSRDGAADRLSCDGASAGRGAAELAAADGKDRVASDCETVAIGAVFSTDPPMEIEPRATGRGRRLRLRLGCTAPDRCSGGVTVATAGGKRLGSAAFRIAAGRTRTVAVRVRGGRAPKALVVTTLTRDFARRATRTTRRVRLRG